MKTRIIIALASLSTVVWLTAALQAQMPPTPLLKVDVPFEFVAGGMNLPAGEYHVLHIMNPNWLLLRNSEGHGVAVVSVQVSQATAGESSTKLVFHRYGGQYFLVQVWTEQDNQVHACLKSTAESALASRSRKPPEVATAYAKP